MSFNGLIPPQLASNLTATLLRRMLQVSNVKPVQKSGLAWKQHYRSDLLRARPSDPGSRLGAYRAGVVKGSMGKIIRMSS